MEECLFCKWKNEKEKIIVENELAFARFARVCCSLLSFFACSLAFACFASPPLRPAAARFSQVAAYFALSSLICLIMNKHAMLTADSGSNVGSTPSNK